jgi:hypothetical protein
MAALVLVLGAVWWSSVAGAQTTSTSSTSSTSSSTSTSTSTSSTTSTTVADPCATQPCTERPPAAFLAGSAGEVALEPGSFCWRSPTPTPPGGFSATCGDRLAFEPSTVLAVTVGETLTLRFSALTPTSVVLEPGDRSTPLTAANPTSFTVDLPVGVRTVGFFTRWVQGDASYYLRLDVRAAAVPQGRSLALTG